MADVQADELERVTTWLIDTVVHEGRGDRYNQLQVKPTQKFWLGRLAPEQGMNLALGDRGERMEPCAIGIRFRPAAEPPWSFDIGVELCAWYKDRGAPGLWRKTRRLSQVFTCTVSPPPGSSQEYHLRDLEDALERIVGTDDLKVKIAVEYPRRPDRSDEIVISCINDSAAESRALGDTGLYKVRMMLRGLTTTPFVLESLPDSFRYDRHVPAIGVNCGVELGEAGELRSCDIILADRQRPIFWNSDRPEPDLRFATLASDPLPEPACLDCGSSRVGPG